MPILIKAYHFNSNHIYHIVTVYLYFQHVSYLLKNTYLGLDRVISEYYKQRSHTYYLSKKSSTKLQIYKMIYNFKLNLTKKITAPL